jgi:hypothetical protein
VILGNFPCWADGCNQLQEIIRRCGVGSLMYFMVPDQVVIVCTLLLESHGYRIDIGLGTSKR